MPKISRLAFIGFGNTAESMLNMGFNRPDRVITAFDPSALDASTCKVQLERYIGCGVQGCFSVSDTVIGAHLVVISDSSAELAPWLEELQSHITPGQIVADLRETESTKQQLKHAIESLGGIYIDGVLSPSENALSIVSEQITRLREVFRSLDIQPDQIRLNQQA